MSSIKVVVRPRPPTESEDKNPKNSVFEYINTQSCIVGSHTFSFDHIFPSDANQSQLFYGHFNEYVDNVLDGFNSAIIAYGQTAAGKSFTMTGGDTMESEGVIPRALRRIFDNQTGQIVATYVEIYNGKLKDLFNNSTTVSLLGDGSLKGNNVKRFASYAEAIKAINSGNLLRSIATTKMNNVSSRSHAVLSLKLETGARLMLVDLAGSEMVRKTGASGSILEEAGSINKSLSSLAMVVSALGQQNSARKQHVPFRSSKITQILQVAFSGETKTSLVINCSPSQIHLAETISSLRFGMRCKDIKVKIPDKEERILSLELIDWRAKINSAILPWKLGSKVQPSEWIDISKLKWLLSADIKTPWKIPSSILHEETGKPVENEASNTEIIEYDQLIEQTKTKINSLNDKIKAREEYVGEVTKLEDGFAIFETQKKLLYDLKQNLIEKSEKNTKLQRELAMARTRPNSEKVRIHLQNLYLRMDVLARKIQLQASLKRCASSDGYNSKKVKYS